MSEAPAFGNLRRLTPARLRLDPAGGAAPLSAVLDFQACHARARDAIHAPVDWAALAAALAPLPVLDLHSRAPDRATYIRRPDLGRRLRAEDAAGLTPPPGGADLAIVVADGLSALAVDRQAAGVVKALVARLPGLRLAPVALVRQGRVAVGDEVADRLGADLCLVLVGERPGLSVADSLGAYLTWRARPGTPDSARNCVSNIHGLGGLGHDQAADRLAWLIGAARARGLTGVGLKDESPALAGAAAPGRLAGEGAPPPCELVGREPAAHVPPG
ncbi:ethanolamine ammonia-lyase subunit EutC [Frigidibacter oleivorans]|uniref:ethanolamine ammonia-lyase subunit EutC n=1 Tax=Frigidibacter oleivorans TaxID=2487129 RepID=UPI000F8D2B8A|nr:ethanolamine ammonia-lyase subunit EutC [Frigidibacter oleivorans]